MTHKTSTLNIYWRLMEGHHGRYLMGAIALFAGNLIGLLPPAALGILVDSATGERLTPSPTTAALVFVLATLLQYLVRYPMRLCFVGASTLVAARLREKYSEHLLMVSSQDLAGYGTGDLVSRATGDLQAVEGAMSTGIVFLLDCSFRLVTLPAAMLLFGPVHIAAVFLPLSLVPLCAHLLVRKIAETTTAAQQAYGRLSQKLVENAASLQTVRSFGLEESEIADFGRICRDHASKSLRVGAFEACFSPSIHTLMAVGSFLVLREVGGRAAVGDLSPGRFVTFFQYFGMMAWPLMGLSWAFLYFKKGEVSFRRVSEVLALPAAEPSAGEPLRAVAGEIEIRNLTYTYPGADAPAICNLSFRLRPGGIVAITGPSGSGKTTLVNLMTRMIEPPSGTIFLDGRDVREIRARDLRDHISVAPQETFLFSGTIQENLLPFGAPGSTPQIAERALEAAGLTNEPQSLGPETALVTRGTNLSGGQRQRVALARAFVRRSSVLILDDALSAVDHEAAVKVWKGLESFAKPATTVVITHRPSQTRTADRILVLEGGRLVEDGGHEDLLSAGRWYAAMVQRRGLNCDLDL